MLRPIPAQHFRPDFYALEVPNEFVFGMGLDVDGKYRNHPGISIYKTMRVVDLSDKN